MGNAVYPANRAMANMKLGKHSEAEEDCTRALKYDPSYEKALFRRAQCRNILGKLEGSKKDFLEVLKNNPSNKLARKELSEIEKRLNKNIKWTFEKPKDASVIKPKMIQINEKNKPEKLQSLKIHEAEETEKST